ncbi:MAG: hypothetical protein NC489_45420, partial [Ruminococcus flavefaciens]|nr:hypothetical protein [Ruminococcus flavefaciens]
MSEAAYYLCKLKNRVRHATSARYLTARSAPFFAKIRLTLHGSTDKIEEQPAIVYIINCGKGEFS